MSLEMAVILGVAIISATGPLAIALIFWLESKLEAQ